MGPGGSLWSLLTCLSSFYLHLFLTDRFKKHCLSGIEEEAVYKRSGGRKKKSLSRSDYEKVLEQLDAEIETVLNRKMCDISIEEVRSSNEEVNRIRGQLNKLIVGLRK